MKEQRNTDDLATMSAGNPPSASMLVISAAGGLLLSFRAFVSHPVSHADALLVTRIALSLCLTVWGYIGFGKASRWALWASVDSRVIFVLAWSSLVSAADVLAGGSPAIFVVGVIYASVVGWSRTGLLVGLSLIGLAAIALAAFFSNSIGNGHFSTEDALVVLGAAGAAMANTRTIRRFIAPSRERLLSLEKENKELWNLSFKDQLTDIYNRRFAQENGKNLITRARRYHEQLHGFMIDIDHFKKVNDLLSHAVGDEVLCGVAQEIQSCLRSSDYLARYGGEEFLVFVTQSGTEGAQFLANRIRDAVASKVFDSVPWKITISIGVTSIAADDTFETFVDRADKYLYLAKRAGRNRVAGY